MSPSVFTGERLITSSGVVDWPLITVDASGIVECIEACSRGEQNGITLAPTFFDVHVHGGAGYDLMEASPAATQAVGQFLATHGVGHYLATTVTAPLDPTLRALDGLATLIEASDKSEVPPPASPAAIPVGIHLEGPFLSHSKRGVHPPEHLLEPSIPDFTRLWNAARGHIRLLTIAPELLGALELIRHASGLGVAVSLGHSDATAAEARAAIAAGAVSATHTFNAMRRLDHREPGLAGVVLDSDALYAELICDGIHVAPEFVRLWMRTKGEERAILVSDGISATGMPDGEYTLGGLAVAVTCGRCLLSSDLKRGVETLAGSVLTLDHAVRNLRRFTGVSLEVAVRAASRNPANLAGLPAFGEIAVGQPANFNLFGSDGQLQQTFLRGQAVPRP